MDDISDDDLLAELGAAPETKRQSARTPREERIIAGFEDILRFYEEHGHAPRHGEENDIFERLYAVRLDRLRDQDDCRELLREFDKFGLLEGGTGKIEAEDIDDESLLAEFGIETPKDVDLTRLTHVKPRAEARAAEEVANRTACADFAKFKPLFEAVQRDLDAGIRLTRPFELRVRTH